jgi:hypothetical protein
MLLQIKYSSETIMLMETRSKWMKIRDFSGYDAVDVLMDLLDYLSIKANAIIQHVM